MVTKLNDTQLTILTNAAGRDDRRILPLPKLRAPHVAVQRTIAKLRTDGLIQELSTADGTLIVTEAGLTAIGIVGETATAGNKPSQRRTAAKDGAKAAKPAKSARTAGKDRTKQEIVISMLRRANGASIAELAKATAWQPHSVRGVLTATIKNRLNLPLISEKGEDGVRRYFVAPIRTGKGKE